MSPETPSSGRTGQPADGGLLLVDKPVGCTSHDVVGRVRWLLATRRVGHAGTLDPMATGLLVVAVERSTRLLGHLALTGKTYRATIRLGQRTHTDDADGDIVDQADPALLAAVSDSAISVQVDALTGEIEQVPSSVSAIKVGGRRSYDRVRAGETVTLAARPVTVSRFQVIGRPRRSDRTVDLDVEVDCSTGTYVRALARDLGTALGVGGHLIRLRRTAVGPFRISEAVDVYGSGGLPSRGPRQERPTELADLVRAAIIAPAAVVRATFPTRLVDEATETDVRHGRPIPAAGLVGTYGVMRADRLLALMQESGGSARPVLVWAPS